MRGTLDKLLQNGKVVTKNICMQHLAGERASPALRIVWPAAGPSTTRLPIPARRPPDSRDYLTRTSKDGTAAPMPGGGLCHEREESMTDQLQNELAKCRAGQAARLCGVTAMTLHNWRRAGKIEAVKDAAGRYLFDVRPFLKDRVA
jgi:hypothetical protein